MPTKKVTAAVSSKPSSKAEPKAASKAATATKGAKTAKASTKSAPKAAQKVATVSNEAVKKSNKRKAEEVDEDEDEEKDDEPAPIISRAKRTKKDTSPAVVNGISKAKTATPEPPAKRKAAVAKAPATKRFKTKIVINHAPTDKLNVYVFGDGTNGELGLGNGKGCTEVKRPRLNPHLSADAVGVVALAVGGMHTAVLTHDNKILTWGVNDQGALGRDTNWEGGLRDIDAENSEEDSDSDEGGNLNPKEASPGEVDMSGLPDGLVWTQLSCTDSATFALTEDGFVYGWGTFRSNEGIFGFSAQTLVQTRPTLVPELKKITKLAAGANHVLALDNKGAVYAWGSGQQNQLGRRILERFLKHSLVPTQFGLPKQMVNVGAGAYHSFAMHKNGKVYSWGLNSFGETGIAKDLGEEGEADVHHATVIESLGKFGKVTHIEGGSHHTVAVTENGELLVWGRLDGSQLGINISSLPEGDVVKDSHGNSRILMVPTQIPGIDATFAAAGSDHCVAISKDGKAYSWGFSTTYQTGLGEDDDVEVATQIDNTAIRGKHMVWSGAGGQFSVIAGLAQEVNGVNGHV